MAGTLDEQISQIEFSCFYNSTAVRLRTLKAQTNAVGRRDVRNMKTLVDSITWQERLTNKYRKYSSLVFIIAQQFVYVHRRHKRMNALSTEPCFPIAGAVTCSRTSASRHTSFVSITQALSFRSLGVRSPSSSHTSRPKTFSFRVPCAGVQIPRVERQWS